jgi:glycosyltransferase involved in cell wall biosynthesis
MMLGLMAMFCRQHGRGLVFRLAHDTDADPKRLLIRYRRDKWLYAYGLRRSHAVLSQHSAQQSALLSNYGVKSTVADMLVDPPASEYDLSRRDVQVLWVNNLRDFKRPELAVELARRLPGWYVHMVGGPQPGFQTLYETIHREAAAVPNLIFHGRVPYHDVGNFYDRARVFVNTSDTEGFPNSYLQSWRRGVPVVAFFDPDGLICREGLGYAVGSMEEMQQAVERLLTDDDEWHRISARCCDYMERHHGDDVVLKPYLDAIKKAYKARRPA